MTYHVAKLEKVVFSDFVGDKVWGSLLINSTQTLALDKIINKHNSQHRERNLTSIRMILMFRRLYKF